MEYTQECIATLHDLTGRSPRVSADRVAVVIPMTERDHATLASERLFSTLETVDPSRVIVALRAPAERAVTIQEWLSAFDLPLEVLWCNAEATQALLTDHGIDGTAGKGRDLWLGLGVAASEDALVLAHDADNRTVSPVDFARLLFPLKREYDFVKGYYARVENGRLYGRLFRLFYEPLLEALEEQTHASIRSYLAAFRYALAGEFGATASLVRQCRPEPDFGFEVGLLGDAFEHAGFEKSAQVDLGRYQHDHRAVSGASGLAEMSRAVGAAVFRVLDENDVSPDMPTLRERYFERAEALIQQYETDAAFNDLTFDVDAEREQVDAYADAIQAPDDDRRLPAWNETSLQPAEVLETAQRALETAPTHGLD